MGDSEESPTEPQYRRFPDHEMLALFKELEAHTVVSACQNIYTLGALAMKTWMDEQQGPQVEVLLPPLPKEEVEAIFTAPPPEVVVNEPEVTWAPAPMEPEVFEALQTEEHAPEPKKKSWLDRLIT